MTGDTWWLSKQHFHHHHREALSQSLSPSTSSPMCHLRAAHLPTCLSRARLAWTAVQNLATSPLLGLLAPWGQLAEFGYPALSTPDDRTNSSKPDCVTVQPFFLIIVAHVCASFSVHKTKTNRIVSASSGKCALYVSLVCAF